MITLSNDVKLNIQELLNTPEVELLFTEMLSALLRENLDLYARTVPLSEKYSVTIAIETKDRHFGENGLYQTLSSDPYIEFKVLGK